jgi:hypothetical protein
LAPGYQLAYSLLADEGSFLPFGAAAGPDGKPTCIMPEDGSAGTVRDELREGCSSGRFAVIALFCEVQVRDNPRAAPQRAVAVYLDTVSGPSRLILTPLVIAGGQVRCGQPTIQDSPEPLLPAEQVAAPGRPRD